MNKLTKATIFIICLLATVFFISIDSNASKVSVNLNLNLIAAIFIAHLFFLLIQAYRYLSVVNNISKIKIRFWNWFQSFIAARLLNKILPQSGNLYRAYQLKKDEGIRYKDYAISYSYITWFDTLTNFLFAFFALLFLSYTSEVNIIIVITFAILFTITAFLPFILNQITSLHFIQNYQRAYDFICYAQKILYNRNLHSNLIFILSILGVASLLLMSFRLLLGFQVIGSNVSFVEILIIYSIYKASLLFVILPGNILLQEFVTGIAAQLLGIGFTEGAAAALFLRLCGYILLGAISLISIVFTISSKHES